jgi:hypothetical protein
MVVVKYASEVLTRHKSYETQPSPIARHIVDKVNADLKLKGFRLLKQDAIRKRVAGYLRAVNNLQLEKAAKLDD